MPSLKDYRHLQVNIANNPSRGTSTASVGEAAKKVFFSGSATFFEARIKKSEKKRVH